jgi:hypothetical protein
MWPVCENIVCQLWPVCGNIVYCQMLPVCGNIVYCQMLPVCGNIVYCQILRVCGNIVYCQILPVCGNIVYCQVLPNCGNTVYYQVWPVCGKPIFIFPSCGLYRTVRLLTYWETWNDTIILHLLLYFTSYSHLNILTIKLCVKVIPLEQGFSNCGTHTTSGTPATVRYTGIVRKNQR